MPVRAPESAEMDAVYMMGYDVWGDGDDIDTHLNDCRHSAKYAAGEWFVWDLGGEPVASLIVFRDGYQLAEQCYGIGAVATEPGHRRQGYASALVQAVVNVLAQRQAKAIFLHCDIEFDFYRRLGFELQVADSRCMMLAVEPGFQCLRLPDYF
ncbi:GNAT family N-acetyltransferase [Saccharospirillum sp. HFRX-1]|uniref:GNAT family N-acetyltransferase n=1 Tax=unclassified Saccharospirillum TaxID=2633430 RepID=UPI00371472E8